MNIRRLYIKHNSIVSIAMRCILNTQCAHEICCRKISIKYLTKACYKIISVLLVCIALNLFMLISYDLYVVALMR